MAVDELMLHIFPNQMHPLVAIFADWLTTSPRFRVFAKEYRDKIRKKVRVLQDVESINDLRCELETVYLLLQERRFVVAYEQGGVGKQRRPDLSVTFKTNMLFHVEVTRLRSPQRLPVGSAERVLNPLAVHDGTEVPDPHNLLVDKVINMVSSKVGQMLPGVVNLLFVCTDNSAYAEFDLAGAMVHMNRMIERKDPRLFERSRFTDMSDFIKHYQRLSGIILRSTPNQSAGERCILWMNRQARHQLPVDLSTILLRL